MESRSSRSLSNSDESQCCVTRSLRSNTAMTSGGMRRHMTAVARSGFTKNWL
jgi:hypothetical protein